MTKKRWNIKEQPDSDVVDAMAKSIGVDSVVATLLLQRGIDNADSALDFFNPDLKRLHDPFLMKDMDSAVARIMTALQRGERILVYGDYDVDGTTAVALVYMVLSRLVSEVSLLDFYIPDRYNEGYGISADAVEYARSHSVSLVIALDCGIKAVERMRAAREYGIDFIICDHHVTGDTLPDVVACLDPKRDDCSYPDKNLSGCGVGFKLMTGLFRRLGLDTSELVSYLDLVVVSIASDIVPVEGENRILAFHGLQRLNTHPHIGLLSIMETAHIVLGNVSVGDIVFKIGPRINAAGRMRSGNDAVRLLVSTDRAEADVICRLINDSNNDRKNLDREITRKALDRIAAEKDIAHRRSIVIYDPQWSKGVIGIVASRLSEKFCRPTIILTRSLSNPAIATGSARSVEGFDLYRAIDACSDLLESFGGHTYAAGLTVRVDRVEAFRESFERYAVQHVSSEVLEPSIDVDLELPLDRVDLKLLSQLERFEPFGPGNSRPVFITRDVYDYSTSKTFGQNHRHLKLDLINADCRQVKKGVGFGLGLHYADIAKGRRFDITYSLEDERHNGKKSLLLSIRDIHYAD